MSKKIKKLIKKYQNQLTYRVEKIHGQHIKTLEISTDHHQHVHRIYIPDNNVRDIEILHEIGHAILSETVNRLFSTATIRSSNRFILDTLTPAIRAADDWFVDQWLIEISPDEERKEIDDHYRLTMKRAQHAPVIDIEMAIGVSFILAQAEKYLGLKNGIADPTIQLAKGVFLSEDPKKPTVAKLQNVINGLLSTYTSYQVKYEDDEWEVIGK